MEAFQDVARGVAQSDGAAVGAVGGVLALGEFVEEPLHLLLVQPHVDFDGGAAGDGGADVAADFVERGPAEFAFGGFENLEKDLFDVAGFDGRRGGGDGDSAIAEGFAIEAAQAEFVGDLRVFELLAGGELDDHRHEQRLLFHVAGGALAQHLFEENAFVSDVLIDDPKPIATGGEDEAFVELAEGAEIFENVERVDGVENNAIGEAAVGVGDFGADGGGGGLRGRGRSVGKVETRGGALGLVEGEGGEVEVRRLDALYIVGRDDVADGGVLHLLGELAVGQAGGGLRRGVHGQRGERAALHDGAANGVAHVVVHPAAVAEADFGFGGVDVDVYLFGVAIEEEQREGEGARGHQVVIGRLHGVHEELVAD